MNCPTCETPLPKGHAVEIGKKMADTLYGWDEIAYSYKEGESFIVPGVGEAVVIAKHVTAYEDQGNDNQPVFMVFQIKDKIYKKLGHGDSYGEVKWDGPFKEAVKKVQTVETYE